VFVLDPAELGVRVRNKRRDAGLSLRSAAEDAQVSFTTLSRVEAGHVPDMTTYRKLLRWLGIGETDSHTPNEPTIQVIAAHLSRDPALAPEDAQRIARVVGELYDALALRRESAQVHLRAATTLRPEAARMLGALITDMYEALLDRRG
jgi:transcriptional regulator with XRE-family HTH domain